MQRKVQSMHVSFVFQRRWVGALFWPSSYTAPNEGITRVRASELQSFHEMHASNWTWWLLWSLQTEARRASHNSQEVAAELAPAIGGSWPATAIARVPRRGLATSASASMCSWTHYASPRPRNARMARIFPCASKSSTSTTKSSMLSSTSILSSPATEASPTWRRSG